MPIQARWLIPDVNPQQAAALAAALRIGLPVTRVLLAREICDADSARRFLRPSLDDLHEPARLRGMTEAVERLTRAGHRGLCVRRGCTQRHQTFTENLYWS